MFESEWASVSVEAFGADLDEEKVDVVIDLLTDLGIQGASVSITDEGRIAFRWIAPHFSWGSADVDDQLHAFDAVMDKAGVEYAGLCKFEVTDGDWFERELTEPAETYLGVAEVSILLDVSKQRVSELRRSAAFPAPLAELRAGPVWKGSSLNRFIDSWERRPGRPKKAMAG